MAQTIDLSREFYKEMADKLAADTLSYSAYTGYLKNVVGRMQMDKDFEDGASVHLMNDLYSKVDPNKIAQGQTKLSDEAEARVANAMIVLFDTMEDITAMDKGVKATAAVALQEFCIHSKEMSQNEYLVGRVNAALQKGTFTNYLDANPGAAKLIVS